MSWMYLFAAAVFEVAFAVSMKASDGFTRPLPSVVTVIGVAGLASRSTSFARVSSEARDPSRRAATSGNG